MANYGQANQDENRTILSLFNGPLPHESDIQHNVAHVLAEMPLNHIGLKVTHLDYNQPLPTLAQMQDVRGVLLWTEEEAMKNPLQLITWLIKAIHRKLPVALMGKIPFSFYTNGLPVDPKIINTFFSQIGLRYNPDAVEITYKTTFSYKNARLVEFERPYSAVIPPFPLINLNDSKARTYLTVAEGTQQEKQSQLITIHPNGAFAAQGFIFFQPPKSESRLLFLNLMDFFRDVFKTRDLPKPDTTTLLGRRIFYSHIDGDGWNNQCRIPKYKKKHALSSEALYEEAFLPYPDLPVTVAPIAGDIDPKWHGTKRGRAIATKIFALDHIQAGSHTYSHPFAWSFFKSYQPDQERPFLGQYKKPWASSYSLNNVMQMVGKKSKIKAGDSPMKNYDAPRAYGVEPFDIKKEMSGSINLINRLLPPGKRVEVMQWSGNTSPFPQALKILADLNIANINGGDSRFDPDFHSLSHVAAIGRKSGKYQQIYASNSNENTYTDLWTGRFFAFKFLKSTVMNTESPYRLKPFNVYYHMYSGERRASLNAVIENLAYARQEKVFPITTRHFTQIAQGFYSTSFKKVGPRRWIVENRGELETIRFDYAAFLSVDFQLSVGVIGQQWYQGSLYVFLDPAHQLPVVTLKSIALNSPRGPQGDYPGVPIVQKSNWAIASYSWQKPLITFNTQGFGVGQIEMLLPEDCNPTVEKSLEKKILIRQHRRVTTLDLLLAPIKRHQIKIWCQQ